MGYPHFRIQLLLVLMVSTCAKTWAQYYHSDLVTLEQLEKRQATYRKQQVKKITETAFLPSGEPNKDYQPWSRVSTSGDSLVQYKKNYEQPLTSTYHFNPAGRLILQSDLQPDMRNEIRYTYDPAGQVSRLESIFFDSLMDFKDHEIHLWQYDLKGRPTRMWRLVEQFEGGYDSTEIRFTIDSAGHVAEERKFKNGTETGFYYYYYNEKGKITDIVRYNDRWKRLLPDQLFEYDDKGNLIQKMILTGSRDVAYLIWRYGYNSIDLLTEEALFNNKKEYSGSIRYTYEFY